MTEPGGEDLAWMSARRLRELIATRQVSPVDVITACLARIGILEPTLHAFITVAADQAVEQAIAAEAAVARGDQLGPLHGVPVAIKDEVWTGNLRSTGGSLLFGRFVPSRDSTVAERLRRAGAIVLGKTNLPEFAAWPRSKTRLVGEAVNPWDPGRISGASSGGSGAALAAGIVPLAIGSDGGGSIRIPSALCGVVGLFPTPGRVPSYGSFSYSLGGSIGPMGRDVRDVALLQSVIAGPDPRDAAAKTEAAPDVLANLKSGVEELRIAWSPDFGRISLDQRIVTAARDAVSTLAAAGARVDEINDRIEHPWGDGAFIADLQAAVAAQQWEFDDTNFDLPDVRREEAWMWEVFKDTVPFTATPQFQALCRRYVHLLTPAAQLVAQAPPQPSAPPAPMPTVEELWAAMSAVFQSHDVICTPTMATVAPPARDDWASPYTDVYMGTNFTFIANATGCPAASIPCGTVDGLPVGLQIIGRPGDEPTVLRVCRALEARQTNVHPDLSALGVS